MENPIRMDDLGVPGYPQIIENPHIFAASHCTSTARRQDHTRLSQSMLDTAQIESCERHPKTRGLEQRTWDALEHAPRRHEWCPRVKPDSYSAWYAGYISFSFLVIMIITIIIHMYIYIYTYNI